MKKLAGLGLVVTVFILAYVATGVFESPSAPQAAEVSDEHSVLATRVEKAPAAGRPKEQMTTSQPPSSALSEVPDRLNMRNQNTGPHKQVELRFLTPQKITSITVKEGQAVAKDTLLALQSTADVDAKIKESRSKLAAAMFNAEDKSKIEFANVGVRYSEEELDKYYGLLAKNSVGEGEVALKRKTFLEAGISLKRADHELKALIKTFPILEAEIEGLLAERAKREILAPWDGQVGEIRASEGQTTDKEYVMTLYDLSQVEVLCAVENSEFLKHPWWQRTDVPIIELTTKDGPVRLLGRTTYIDEVVVGSLVNFKIVFENKRTNNGWLVVSTSPLKVFFEEQKQNGNPELARN